MSFTQKVTTIKPAFSIECKVVTPLTQIDPVKENDPATKAPTTKTKVRKVLNSKGEFEPIPLFSANALRSACREMITRDIHRVLNEKGSFSFELSELQAYTTGGGSDAESISRSITFGIEREMRLLSPFFSVFGLGLGGIEGKSAFTSLVPPEGARGIGYSFGVRAERTKNSNLMTLVDEESVLEWLDSQAKNSENNKEYRKASDEVEKLKKAFRSGRKNNEDVSEIAAKLKEAEDALAELVAGDAAFQQVFKYEYIIPGTVLHGCVTDKAGYRFSDVEEGMILSALIETSKRQLGAMKAVGHGILDWSVVGRSGDKLFSITADPSYVFDRTLEVTPAGEKMLEAYRSWLDAQSADLIGTKDIYAAAEKVVMEQVAAKGKGAAAAASDNLFG